MLLRIMFGFKQYGHQEDQNLKEKLLNFANIAGEIMSDSNLKLIVSICALIVLVPFAAFLYLVLIIWVWGLL